MIAESLPIARSGVSAHRRTALVAAVLLMLAVPFFAAEIPPVLDYPNHLARALLLTLGQSDAVLSQMYAPNWSILPNLALDLVLPPLLYVLPLDVAGRLILAGSLFAPLAGAALYGLCLFGRKSWWWPLCSAVVAFNAGFLLGFMNFLCGLGAAFAVAALWLKWRERRPAAAVLGAAAGGAIVFFCHIAALGLLGALIAGYEVDRLCTMLRRGDFTWRDFFWRGLAAASVFVPAVLLYALSPTSDEVGAVVWPPSPAVTKPVFLFAAVMNYSLALDLATAAALVCVLWVGVRNGWLKLPRSTAVALALLTIAYLVTPFRIQGGAFFDFRFAVMIGYVLCAGLAETGAVPRRVGMAVIAGLVALAVVRVGAVAVLWHGYGDEVAEMRAAIAPVPAGAKVLVALVTSTDAPEYWRDAPAVRRIDAIVATDSHLPALLLAQRGAFSPLIFADPGKQPIRVRAAFADLAPPRSDWGLPSYRQLRSGPLTAEEKGHFPYLPDWPDKFDYLLVVDADGLPAADGLPHDRLKTVVHTGTATLFRILPASTPDGRSPPLNRTE
jgi:MFS family permease